MPRPGCGRRCPRVTGWQGSLDGEGPLGEAEGREPVAEDGARDGGEQLAGVWGPWVCERRGATLRGAGRPLVRTVGRSRRGVEDSSCDLSPGLLRGKGKWPVLRSALSKQCGDVLLGTSSFLF